MDNFGIYKLISSLTSAVSDKDGGEMPFNKNNVNSIEQIIKTVIPYLAPNFNKNNQPTTEPSKTKNKTDATTQIMRQHDEFVQKVYQTHGKNLKR